MKKFFNYNYSELKRRLKAEQKLKEKAQKDEIAAALSEKAKSKDKKDSKNEADISPHVILLFKYIFCCNNLF